MSYPEPRYFGDTGEVSALYRPAAQPPELKSPVGTFRYLATTRTTRGEYGLYRVDAGPGPFGVATHFHRTISEGFFILSGTLRIYDGERWVDAGEGDFMHVPAGGLHAFHNASEEEAVSFLMLFTPGAPREGYFEGAAELATMTDEERAEFLVRHDSYFTGG
ncbi:MULTISPECIES: cupin domain-containing protein [Thermomonospora]|uniref:Mannose-6-phosphate isomerase-like protein (Cupin superfamily) n=1 Tax=Thermomonospora cellulosilytica TaxID=1411118 RepID=A0A7W3R7F8_9ACTN|nr:MULTISPECIES: cupin domain-containing protein [Thermomonospora]MBA9002581.1 mannose-6-phosphate isomerase-like protein (cupin superfamily) [Thermomonospora cellulosilytica]